MDSPTLAAPLLLAVVLVVSGLAKLRAPEASADAFVALRLPAALARLGAARVLPWAELALALGLLLAPGVGAVVVAVAVTALMAAYLVVVARALGFGEPVHCACFGDLGLGLVTRVTVARNTLLVALGAVAVVGAVRDGGTLERLRELSTSGWGWLLAVAAALVLGALVTYGGAPVGATAPTDADGEYVRHPIPYLEVEHLVDGTVVGLHQLVRERPALLMQVSLSCSSCVRAMVGLPPFVAANPEVDAYVVLQPPEAAQEVHGIPDGVRVLVDRHGSMARAFGWFSPGAVLLGADQLVAGGPVNGAQAVLDFLDDISLELRAARS